MAKLVAAGETLRNQVNKRFPNRDKSSDGWIGDTAHQARPSDHNPDSRGWVHAIDIDEDFGAKGDNRKFADQLVAYARDKRKGSERLKYVVYEDQVASGTYSDTYWVFRGSGYDHTHHIHVSFTSAAEKDGKPFDLPIFDPTAVWDGYVPEITNVLAASKNAQLKNKAAWRLACRLKDLGYYTGDVKPEGEQGYPVNAVKAYQNSIGVQATGNYGPRLHKRIFDLI
jgi:hypothetical protein